MRPSFLDRFLSVDPARPALRFDRWWTYGELRETGEAVAGWLREHGVRSGDRVVVQLENGPALVAAHLGCMALGAVRVPLNAHYRALEVAPIVEDAAPVLVIAEDPALFPGLPVFAIPGASLRVSDWPSPPDDITALLFTSGTTGRPKGVPQTFSMWESNLDALAMRWRLTPEDCLHLALPLFHTHGLVLGLHGTLLRGASAVVRPRFEPEPPQGDVVFGVPTFYRRWLPVMTADPGPFSSVRLYVSGSDGLPHELSDAVHAAIGHRILERYGMTETVMITSHRYEDRRPGTVGPPVNGVEVRIVDGEVQVRGPNVFPGYRPRPDPGAFVDGWFRTGDSGKWDGDSLRIVGRQKELIIVGGVNVSPAEVEAVLGKVPGVVDVGVCGIPDEDLGEVVVAAIVGDVDEGRLRKAAAALSGLKRPRRYAFVDALPRNALGKLQRARIRSEVFSA